MVEIFSDVGILGTQVKKRRKGVEVEHIVTFVQLFAQVPLLFY